MLHEFPDRQVIREDAPSPHPQEEGTPTRAAFSSAIASVATVLWSIPQPFVCRWRRTLPWRHRLADTTSRSSSAQPRPDRRAKILSSLPLSEWPPLLIFGSALVTTVPSIRAGVPICSALAHHRSPPGLPCLFAIRRIRGVRPCRLKPSRQLTDGLDGLAIGCHIIAAGALTVLTYVSGNVVFSDYLELQHMPKVAELTILAAPWSAHPSAFSGTTPTPLKSLWAMLARSRSRRHRHRCHHHPPGTPAAFHRRRVHH